MSTATTTRAVTLSVCSCFDVRINRHAGINRTYHPPRGSGKQRREAGSQLRRIVHLTAFGNQRLVDEELTPLAQLRRIGLGCGELAQVDQDGMRGIDLQ